MSAVIGTFDQSPEGRLAGGFAAVVAQHYGVNDTGAGVINAGEMAGGVASLLGRVLSRLPRKGRLLILSAVVDQVLREFEELHNTNLLEGVLLN